ncbi:hypothetical protein [Paenibacillus donghaensis]|uniref:Uncharacterized protein n=1 Tax=Paenibacillus donghaensis TaxID=414771 RepID=A0A2Z2KFF0_9BACL|nr:hypothetical protein [Paenibacillus donghaensis]ASA22705.1 hypothetical protein B9T62_19050 [Paenibacillus donghaensis]
MKKTKKQKLQDHCVMRLNRSYSEGGIAGYNECNQFLCDLTPQLVGYLTTEGLEFLKKELDRTYDNMPDFDKGY